METEGERSVTRWISALKAGDEGDAPRRLCDRYLERLARLAHGRLRAVARGPVDGEDVALSALGNFFEGVSQGKFPLLVDRDDLWRLLTTMAARKASNQRRWEGQLKRGGGRVIGGSDLAAADSDGGNPLGRVASPEPPPDIAAALAEELESRMNALPDDSLRVVALLRLEGHSNEEIAGRLGCGLRSVERKIGLLRRAWSKEADA
jgi:DNA-directed RNA polymerase specialized sigma24 family protein